MESKNVVASLSNFFYHKSFSHDNGIFFNIYCKRIYKFFKNFVQLLWMDTLNSAKAEFV